MHESVFLSLTGPSAIQALSEVCLLDGEALPEYKTLSLPRHDSAVCSAFHRPRRRVLPPLWRTVPLSIPIAVRFRFGSLQTAVLKASPAIYFINTPQGEARRAHLQYSTSVFLELSEIHLHDVFGMLHDTNDLTEALSGLRRPWSEIAKWGIRRRS